MIFSYFQLKSSLNSLLPEVPSHSLLSPFEHYCFHLQRTRGLLNSILLGQGPTTLLHVLHWEEDFHCHLYDADWSQILDTIVIKANYKVLIYWYMVSSRLVKFVPIVSFCRCSVPNTDLNIWWACPKNQTILVAGIHCMALIHQRDITAPSSRPNRYTDRAD